MMHEYVVKMVEELVGKSSEIPEQDDFKIVYTEFKPTDKDLCITDVLLAVIPVPGHLDSSGRERYLELRAYKLPCPYKATRILKKGTKEEIMNCLRQQTEVCEKIEKAIPELDLNLWDV